MALYIVRSNNLRPSASLSFAATKLAPACRKDQVNELAMCRLQDPVDDELRRWVNDAKESVRPVSDGGIHTKITGTTLLEMSPEEASRLEEEVRDVSVIRDRPIDLIRPRRQTASARASVNRKDLWHLGSVGLDAARRAGFKGGGEGVTVAVLDTGIDDSHLEIAGRVTESVTYDVTSWQATVQPQSQDTDGHGTHVAGLISGRKVGVAPAAKLINGIMIPQGTGNISDFVLAVEWAGTREEVQIVNMSAGIRGFIEELLPDAVEGLLAVGVLPIIATGNEGRNRTRSPGNYDSVLSVGATNEQRRVAGFSSSGSILIGNQQYGVPDLVAPGESVTSCVMGGGYEAWDGTSMATPIVSGIAALALERWPTIAIPDLIDRLLRSCIDLGEPPLRQGAGLIQVPEGLVPKARAAKKTNARRRAASGQRSGDRSRRQPRRKG